MDGARGGWLGLDCNYVIWRIFILLMFAFAAELNLEERWILVENF